MSAEKTVSVVPVIQHKNVFYMLFMVKDKTAYFYGNDKYKDDVEKYKCAAEGLKRDTNSLMVVKNPKDLEKTDEIKYKALGSNTVKNYYYKKLDEGNVNDLYYIILQDMNDLKIMNTTHNKIMKKNISNAQTTDIIYINCEAYVKHYNDGNFIEEIFRCDKNLNLVNEKLPEPYKFDKTVNEILKDNTFKNKIKIKCNIS